LITTEELVMPEEFADIMASLLRHFTVGRGEIIPMI
jgi:hypothetical protein